MIIRKLPMAKEMAIISLLLSLLIFGTVGFVSYLNSSAVLADKSTSAIKTQMETTAELIELQYDNLLSYALRNADVFSSLYNKPKLGIRILDSFHAKTQQVHPCMLGFFIPEKDILLRKV